MKEQMLAKSSTREKLTQLIYDYYYCPDTLILHDNGTIETGRGIIENVAWAKKKDYFVFKKV
jgi:hypothetical protein